MEIINESNNRSYIYKDIKVGTTFKLADRRNDTVLIKTSILYDNGNNTYSIDLKDGNHCTIDPAARVIVVDAQLHVKG